MIKTSFVEMLEGSLRTNWDLPALSDYKEEAIHYGRLADRILWLHSFYGACGIKRGDKIALLGRNSANWGVVYLATVSYGAVIVPILPDFHTSDCHHIINHADNRLLFVADAIYEKLDEGQMPLLEGIISLQDFSLLLGRKKSVSKARERADEEYLAPFGGSLTRERFHFPVVGNEELAAILYTSGTSGFSKGAMLPHNSLAANVEYAQNSIELRSGQSILSFLPAAHAFGCTFDFLFPICTGCHVTFLSQIPSPKVLVQALALVRPHLILSVPLVIEKLYRKNIKPLIDKVSIRALSKVPGVKSLIHKKIRAKLFDVFGGRFMEVVIGGAAINEEVESFLRQIGFPYTVGYGMTECGPLISYSRSREHRFGGVGKTVYTLKLRIDPQVTQSSDGSGEIQVWGENVMTGYFKNESATREVFTPDGWLHTGDVGIMDDDGFIYLKGRHKSMLLGPSGQNIYPEEIEARLNNLPFIEESLVIDRGQRLLALVYPSMEAADAEGIDETALGEKMKENLALINEQLPAYSKLSAIEIFPQEFEKTPTKKIKRFLYTQSRSS
jgi:long-chain acyl-CoA synthetase